MDGATLHFTIDLGYVIGAGAVMLLGWLFKRGLSQLDTIAQTQLKIELTLTDIIGQVAHLKERLDSHVKDNQDAHKELFKIRDMMKGKS